MEILAQKRVLELQSLTADFAGMPLAQIDMMKQSIVAMEETQVGQDELGQPIMGPHPITRFDVFMEQLFNQSDIRFNKYEDLEIQAKFFIEQLQLETGKDKPNWVFIEAVTLVMGMVEQASLMLQQEAMANSPEMQMQQQQIAQQQNAEKESVESEREHSDETAETERDAAREDADAEFKRKMVEKGADHEAAKEIESIKAKSKEKEKPAPKKK